ncbi:unnamed protein product [Caenorhabditis bovis]|uniref:Dynein heavy chain coiled coil stalk domain-containing protein n=1 Tax=Caenorhabditis bovis TaxID=2654633 RepID=A0A8S1ETJ7_9PELO|nr:unnamed protein product [Caenorhabditis bovis]
MPNNQKELENEGAQLKDALHTCEQIEKLAEIGSNVDIEKVQNRIIVQEETLSRLHKESNEKSAKIEILSDQIRIKEQSLESMKAEEEALKATINAMILGPQEEVRKCVEEILKYSPSDMKELTKIAKPSVGIRLCCEMLRTIFDANFKPKKNVAEMWAESQKFLLDKMFLVKVATFDAESLTVEQMKVLKKYVERAEFNANRIENESRICAGLCRWISAFLELACTLRLVESQMEEAKELRSQLRQIEDKYDEENNEMKTLKEDVENLSISIRENEQNLASDRRLCDYRLRSGDLLEALSSHRKRWVNELTINVKRSADLVGNTLLFSIYRALLLAYHQSVSMTAIQLCARHLTEENISFEPSVITQSNVVNTILRNLRESRRFCLFINKENDDILRNLKSVIPNATYLDMGSTSWQEPSFITNLSKYIYSVVPTVFYNFQTCPPPEMYEILMKSEDKEMCYRNKPIELPEDIVFVFVAKNDIHIPDQIKKLMELIVVNNPIDPIDDKAKMEKRELANLLCEFTAADILESRDLVRKALQLAQSL